MYFNMRIVDFQSEVLHLISLFLVCIVGIVLHSYVVFNEYFLLKIASHWRPCLNETTFYIHLDKT